MTPLSRTGNGSHPPWSCVRFCDRVRALVHYNLGFPFRFQQQRPNLWFQYPAKEGGVWANKTNRNFSLSHWPSRIFWSSKTTGPGLTTVSVMYENNSCLWSSSGWLFTRPHPRCSQHQGSVGDQRGWTQQKDRESVMEPRKWTPIQHPPPHRF